MKTTVPLKQQLAQWRRDFHAHPEPGFCEFRTASRVCDTLSTLPGCKIRVGHDVMVPDARMGVPTPGEISKSMESARAGGAPARWLDSMSDGLTGVVADWVFTRPGPTLVVRVDMDALPVQESADAGHKPFRDGFASKHSGCMHACGHDGHTAVGLGLATMIAQRSAGWGGRLRIIFQPAEEGCRGAASMVAAGVVDDADYFVAGHLGTAADTNGLVCCGTGGWLATTKLDVTLLGTSAHAGMQPHEGRNALLAAATLTLQLHALSRHGGGESRVNVGVLKAGSGRNIIADRAELKIEVRGATTAVNDFMTAEARRVIDAAAAMHGVKAEITVAGAATSAPCDPALRQVVRDAAESLPQTTRVIDMMDTPGSEDATFFMNAVQARGGQATYLLVGSALAAGHHHPRFDFDEESLFHATELYAAIADRLLRV